MGLRSWLRRQLNGERARIDLVTPASVSLTPPIHAGLDSSTIPSPWSVARLQALFEALAHQPSTSSDRAARLARHQLSKFWLAAPVDQLRLLYEGEIGDLQRLQLTGPLVQQDLAADEIRWRDQLLQRLEDPSRAAERVNLLLALMPYTQPRKLSVADPLSTLPDWLINDYSVYCEPDLAAPVGLLEPASELEPLTERRGEDAMAWFRDEAVVARMKDLIQAYRADASNQDTLQELAGLRRVLAQLWLDVDPVQLQTLDDTAVGEVTKLLICSGFSAVLQGQDDLRARQQLTTNPIDLGNPGAEGRVVAALMFVPPGEVPLDNMEDLPPWLIEILRQHVGG